MGTTLGIFKDIDFYLTDKIGRKPCSYLTAVEIDDRLPKFLALPDFA